MAATPVSGSTLPGGRVPQTVPRPRGRPRGSRTRHSFGTPLSSRTGRAHHSTAQRAIRNQQNHDHYKPREERSYKEFHKDLDVDATLLVFDSNEVDGITSADNDAGSGSNNGENGDEGLGGSQQPSAAANDNNDNNSSSSNAEDAEKMNVDGGGAPAIADEASLAIIGPGDTGDENSQGFGASPQISDNGPTATTSQTAVSSPGSFNEVLDGSLRRPRPQRRSTLSALQKPLARPARTPRKYVPPPPQLGNNIHDHERLSLPVPSFRTVKPFEIEKSGTYIDRAMASVGFQETDYWQRPNVMVRNLALSNVEDESDLRISSDKSSNTVTVEPKISSNGPTVGAVEYDMDEQDDKWLVSYNKIRAEKNVPPISREIFEVTITKIEKEWHALQKKIPKPGSNAPTSRNKDGEGDDGEDADSKCWICDDGECENSNAIVFCDGCDLAVHQDCYGVPFIPEGQWLCRKCQLLTPRQTAECIFCPNTDGAFKQTVSTKWCHLLCALWIPEVSIQNMTFMEPVEGVERVPKQRWRLNCYICRQRMGACIQCSNKNCFLAFHVTCARRAKLFLKMKTHAPGSGVTPGENRVLLEPSQLKAFCDKHVPNDWRKDNNTDQAFQDAVEFYQTTMANKSWGDSQALANSLPNSTPQTPFSNSNDFLSGNGITPLPKLTLKLSNKRKRITGSKNKIVWKLPSGAPVVPNILYNTVVSALQRFTVRQSKEYAAEVCKYWTLKREARRDASLLKRLQLANQAEAFTSNEVTRKNYAAMGPDGKAKLQRRLEFAIKLRHDLERLRLLCDDVKKREREKLKNAECLREMVDVVYFPITPLVRPALERAQQLDSKDIFHAGLSKMWKRLQDREYNTVAQFQRDLDNALAWALAKHNKDKDKAAAQEVPLPETPLTPAATGIAALPSAGPSTAPTPGPARHPLNSALGQAYSTAKRILNTVQPILDDAREKERQLREDPYERAAYESEDRAIQKRRRRESMAEMEEDVDTPLDGAAEELLPDTANDHRDGNQMEVDTVLMHAEAPDDGQDKAVITPNHPRPTTPENNNIDDDPGIIGLPWYTIPFSPKGTSLLVEERWMGREVMREMSPLSEIDEDQLEDLANGNEDDMMDSPVAEQASKSVDKKQPSTSSKSSKPKSRSKKLTKSKSSKSAKSKKAVSFRAVTGVTRSAAKEREKKRNKRNKGYVYVVVDDEGNEIPGTAEAGDPTADEWIDLEPLSATSASRQSIGGTVHFTAEDDDDANASITVAHNRAAAMSMDNDEDDVGDDSMQSRMSRILEDDNDSDISEPPPDSQEDPAILEQMDIDGQLAKEMKVNSDSANEEDKVEDGEMEGVQKTEDADEAIGMEDDGDVELKDASDDGNESTTGEESSNTVNGDSVDDEGDTSTNGVEATSPETDDSKPSSGSVDGDREDDGQSSTDNTEERGSNDLEEDAPSPATDSTAFHTPAEEPLPKARSKSSSTRALTASTANLNIDDIHEWERSENGENAPPDSSGKGRKSSRKSVAMSPTTPTRITLATPTPPTTRSRKKQEMPPSSNTRSGGSSTKTPGRRCK